MTWRCGVSPGAARCCRCGPCDRTCLHRNSLPLCSRLPSPHSPPHTPAFRVPQWLGAMILCTGSYTDATATDDNTPLPFLLDTVKAYDCPLMLAEVRAVAMPHVPIGACGRCHHVTLHINNACNVCRERSSCHPSCNAYNVCRERSSCHPSCIGCM